MTKTLDFKRCKTFIAMLLVLCQFLSIFGVAMPFNLSNAHAADGVGDEIVYHDLIIYKVDQDGNPVEEASLQLINANTGEVQKEWTTTQNPELAFSGTYEVNAAMRPVPEGYAEIVGDKFDFILHEVSAPEGYELAEDMDLSFLNVFTQYTINYNGFNPETYGFDGDQNRTIDSAMSENLGFDVIKMNDWLYLKPPKQSGNRSFEFVILMIDEKTASEIIKPEDSNPDPNTELSTEFEKVDKGEDIVVTFENEIETKQSLTVSKVVKWEQPNGTLVDHDSEREYKFRVYIDDLPIGHVIHSTIGDFVGENWIGDSSFINETIYLKHGESVKFENIPVGAAYRVTEEGTYTDEEQAVTPVYAPSYLVTGLNVKTATDSTYDYHYLSTDYETIEPTEEASVVFTNTIKSATGKLVVSKNIEGADMGEEFEFTVTLKGEFIKGTQVFNGVTFNNGVGTFILRNGEKKEFELPKGTIFKVEEAETENYITSMKLVEEAFIESADEASIDEYSIMPLSDPPPPEGMLIVQKVDKDGNPVVGAKLQVVTVNKETGEESVRWNGEWVTTEEPFTIDEFDYCFGGYYEEAEYAFDWTWIVDNSYDVYLREVESPDVYKAIEDIKITTDMYEGVEIQNGENSSRIEKQLNLLVVNEKETDPDTPYQMGIIKNNKTMTVEVTNTFKTGYLRVEKTVEGAVTDEEFEFTVTLTGPEISGTQEFGGVTFVDGVGTFTLKHREAKDFDLPTGTEYEVEEVKHNGYETSYEVEEIDPYAVTPMFFTNIVVNVLKTDDNNNPLAGAVLQVIDETGYVVDEWTTTTEAHEVLEVDRNAKFIIHEVSAPDGYECAEDIEFTTGSEQEQNISITMVDKRSVTYKDVVIHKIDNKNNYVQGATLQLINASTYEVVDEWVTGNTAHTVTVDDYYNYIVREVSAPEGYTPASDITFNPNETTEVRVVNVKDNKNVTIKKVDEDGAYVQGATLQVLNASTNEVVAEWVSGNGEYIVSLDPDYSYILHEVSAPEGYVLAEEDITFNPNEVTEVTMLNNKLKIMSMRGTVDSSTCDVVKVTNKAKATLTVSKVAKEELVDGTLTETVSEQEFDFTVNFTGLGANNIITSTIGDVIADTNGNATVTFKLKHNENTKFYNLPIGSQYNVVEAGTEGYQASYLLSGLEVDTNAGNAEESAELATTNQLLQVGEQASVIFTNIQKYQGGKLIVKKEVVDAPENSNEKFEFIITLTGDKIGPEENFNGVDFINGVATIELVAGERKEFDIPAGTTYKVEETKYANYETSYSMEVVDPYAVMPTAEGTGISYLWIYKTDEEGNYVEGATLQLTYPDGTVIEEWTSLSSPKIYTIPNNGRVLGCVLHEVSAPAGYEIADDIILSRDNVVYSHTNDNSEPIYKVYMIDEKIEESIEPITYMTGSITKDKHDVVTVTNTYTAVDIALSKTVDNPEVMIDNEKFVIEGTFSNLEANKTYEISNGFTMTADENGNASYVARLDNGEKIVFKGIPVDAIYSFEEKAGNYIASYEIVDKNK